MTRRILVVVLLALGLPLAGEELKFPTLKVGATTYSNVVITDLTATDLYFKHSGGMGNTKLRYLEPDMQIRFHYHPEAAAEAEKQAEDNTLLYQQFAVQNSWIKSDTARANEAANAEAAGGATRAEKTSMSESVSDNSPLNKPAPAINVEKWFNEKPGDLNGKFVCVLFWNSTSDACRRAIADLNDLQKKFPTTLVVIGITPESPREVAQMTDPPIEFACGSDPQSVTRTTANVTTVPSVLLVDSKNIVRYAGHPAALKDDAFVRMLSEN